MNEKCSKEFDNEILELDIRASDIESSDPQAALEIWNMARQLVINRLERSPSHNLRYMNGYLGYMLWARTGGFYDEVENILKQCWTCDPTHGLSGFFLGRLYYESRHFVEASQVMNTLHMTSKDYFLGIGQLWRYVKVVETLLAIEMESDNASAICGRMIELLECYRTVEDPEGNPPRTIAPVLDSMIKKGNRPKWLPKALTIVAEIVRITKSEEFFQDRFPDLWNEALRCTGPR